MPAVPAMPVMHEKMHHGTSKEQEKRQHAKEVRGVLGEEIEAGDQEEAAQHDAAARFPPWR